MKLVPTRLCQPGMKLGKALYSEDGRVLLGFRCELTRAIIQKLSQLGFEYLYIFDEKTEDIVVEEMIRPQTRAVLRSALTKLMETLENDPALRLQSSTLLSSLFFDPVMMVIHDLCRLKTDSIMHVYMDADVEGNPFLRQFMNNAINVCVYATQLGIIEGVSGTDLLGLSYGALLHDVGMSQVRHDLLRANRRLTSYEYTEIRKHTELGYRFLKEDASMPTMAAIIAYQHHERVDGSGYYGMKGNEIHHFARWIGLLDSYDAMVHNRSYRKAIPPHQALEILYAGASRLYDYNKVEVFRNKVAIYPVGMPVRLNTGHYGIVSKQNEHYKHRPMIRVLTNENGDELMVPYDIDLSKELCIFIECLGDSHVVA
jgi:hypothetical protein